MGRGRSISPEHLELVSMVFLNHIYNGHCEHMSKQFVLNQCSTSIDLVLHYPDCFVWVSIGSLHFMEFMALDMYF